MSNLISPEYAALNKQLHEDRPDYGIDGDRNAKQIAHVAKAQGFKSVLDYGCGKGRLKIALAQIAPDLEVLEYDPAIPGKDSLAGKVADLVVVLDVMEHIEPAHLDAVLASIRDATRGAALLLVTTVPATKNLPDGRNAHLIVQPDEWWLGRLAPYFKTAGIQKAPTGFMFTGLPIRAA